MSDMGKPDIISVNILSNIEVNEVDEDCWSCAVFEVLEFAL